jgi:cbb3-type cytochrome c oxidase subunit II
VSRSSRILSGWQGVCLVAIPYVYFLIFAQFAFLKKLNQLGISGAHLKIVMAGMAAGGILLSVLAPRVSRWRSPQIRLRAAFLACAVAALLAVFRLDLAAAESVAILIGAGLGLLTVTVATHLREWAGTSNPFLAAGGGTGLAYFACNIPGFFDATPHVQSVAVSALCIAAAAIPWFPPPPQNNGPEKPVFVPFLPALAAFTSLVWLDSAAFFIIQNSPLLKGETWQGSAHLWLNAFLHLAAALAGAWLLAHGKLSRVLIPAVAALGFACLLLRDPSSAPIASVLYPIGVSLYSVALVAYPSLMAPARTTAQRGRIAGWIYAIAGWVGSALGIGMGQNLGHVPIAFAFSAAAVVVVPAAVPLWHSRRREIALTAMVLASAWLLSLAIGARGPIVPLSPVARGRQVYISEGCIHCHTQYVRPGSSDEILWGPLRSIAEVRQDRPPLIGNRRQGPDLSQVGVRRSALWLKMHFFNPAEVSGASIMPSYGFLFRDERGNDLVAYLMSLHGSGATMHLAEQQAWRPAPQETAAAKATDGEGLYRRDCATCHSESGATRIAWMPAFKKVPVDLTKGPYSYLSPGAQEQRWIQLARIIKFGIAGTDMAGHEYLSDRDVSSLALWLSQHLAQSNALSQSTTPLGDER